MGILTDGEKEVMCDDLDLSERAREQREVRARRHIREAIIELADLRHCLSDDDFRQIFEPGNRSQYSAEQLERATRNLVRFAYRGLWAAHPSIDVKRELGREIQEAENERVNEYDINPSIVNQAYDRLEEGATVEDLTPAEKENLITASMIGYRAFETESDPFLWKSAKSEDE